MKQLHAFLLVSLSLAYPLAVYAALGRFEPRWMAVWLLALALLRALATRQAGWWWAAAGAALLALLATVSNDALPLKLYPVLVNAALLAVFAASLRHPPSVVERIARVRHGELPPQGVAYTARVTRVWCGFFVLNGAVALGTALWADDRTWALYNGLLAYVAMGLLFAGEWCVRRRVLREPARG